MKLASFVDGDSAGYGIVADDRLHPVEAAFRSRFPDLRSVLAAARVADLAGNCAAQGVPLADMALLPPIPRPGKIVCIGMNYRKPYPVDGAPPPDPGHVVMFARHPETLVGHGAPLEQPVGEAAETFDFEGEIVAVIGKAGRHIAKADAMGHVMGYSAMNEGSVRGWMKHSVHAGKNFHASGSWGPWIATADETGDLPEMSLETRVDGTLMQQATGAEMVFDLPTVIEYVSHLMPLQPGDIIATGSPDGTGGSREPPAFLKPGDVVEVTVGGVGTLRNKVVSAADARENVP